MSSTCLYSYPLKYDFLIKFSLMYLLTVLTIKYLTFMYPGNNNCSLHIYNLKMSQSYIGMKPFSKFLKVSEDWSILHSNTQWENKFAAWLGLWIKMVYCAKHMELQHWAWGVPYFDSEVLPVWLVLTHDCEIIASMSQVKENEFPYQSKRGARGPWSPWPWPTTKNSPRNYHFRHYF